MTDRLNVYPRNSQDLTRISENLSSCDFITTFPDGFQLPLNISNENANFNRLKRRINCFFQEHANVVTDIKNYFYDEMITYTLKRSLNLPFTKTEIAQTQRLLNRFFIEHETNINIFFNYIFDDIQPFLPNNLLFYIISQLPTANPTVNDGKCKLLIILLQFKGAQLLTEILYHTTLQENLSDNLSEQPQSTSNQMKCLLSLLYIVLLCIIFGWKIVFHIISCSVIGLVFVIFYVYLSMRYL